MVDSLVYDDSSEESWPSIATASNGDLYVAYQHYDSGLERYRIYISKSTNGGQSWTLFHTVQHSTNLLHPSIAIDPYDDRIYVAYERETTADNHDILCSIYTGTEWILSVVDNDAGNDQFPSVTSDYQFGSSNYQYISYEYLYSYNDRDLNVAKSEDHGVSWQKNWHYRDGGSYDLSQTSITTSQDGHVYVVVAEATEHESLKWLNVYYGDRASTSGTFEYGPKTIWGYDDGLYGASLPSIAASHYDSNQLVVAFQRYVTSTNDDVCCSYTTDGGASWLWRNISSTGYNERHPTITIDGQGSTSTSVLGYFRVAYYYGLFTHYKQTYYLSLGVWSEYPEGDNPVSGGSGTGVNTQERSMAITTQEDGDGWWPNIVWTDNRGGSYDLYSTTPGNNPIIPEFPSFLVLPTFMIATLMTVIAYRKKRIGIS